MRRSDEKKQYTTCKSKEQIASLFEQGEISEVVYEKIVRSLSDPTLLYTGPQRTPPQPDSPLAVNETIDSKRRILPWEHTILWK